MITEVSPNATVVLDGSGNGQVSLGPPSGTKWALRLATLAVSTSTKQPQGFLYRGSASGPLELVDSTYTGAQASSAKVGGALYYPGQRLWAKWTGGDPGATATLQAYGQQGARSDPFEPGPPGEGFANPVVAGTALIIPAINSPNFVHNSAGWSINRDGTAEFNNATIRGELDVGVSPNPRIAITSTVPAALATWAAGNSVTISELMILYWNATDFKWWATGTFVGQNCTFTGTYDTTNGVYVLERTLDTGASAIETRFGSYSLNAFQELWTTQQVKLRIGDGSNINDAFVCNGTAVSNAIAFNISGNGTAETWHALSLNAPWTNRGAGFPVLSYKKVAAPDNAVWLVGQITVGGAASGSVIATLPAGYRPTTAVGAAAGDDGAANEVLVEVETTGDIKAFCIGFSTHIQINMLIPLDL